MKIRMKTETPVTITAADTGSIIFFPLPDQFNQYSTDFNLTYKHGETVETISPVMIPAGENAVAFTLTEAITGNPGDYSFTVEANNKKISFPCVVSAD